MATFSLKVTVDDKKLLKHYNSIKDSDTIEELEDYVGHDKPFMNWDIPLLTEYHMLGADFVKGISLLT